MSMAARPHLLIGKIGGHLGKQFNESLYRHTRA